VDANSRRNRRHRIARAIAAGLLASAVAACQATGTTTPPEFPVVSLREVLPALQQEAREWRGDAYLSWVEIPLKEHPSGGAVAYAAYQTLGEEDESLLVTLQPDNSASSEKIPHEVPVIQVEPIVLDHSILDSGEALGRALELAGTGTSSMLRSGCSFLMLERLRGADVRPIIWRLVLRECLTPAAEQIRIDARSGELVKYP